MTAYVGLDLSLTSTGLAVIADGDIRLHRIVSKGTRGDSLTARKDRLDRILDGIARVVPLKAVGIAIEGPSYGQRHQSGVHDRSWLWGKVVDYLTDTAQPVIEVAPTVRAKYATGKGNASKDAVLAAACRRYPHVDVTGNDVADALVLAAIAARLDGHPIEASLPLANLAALDKLRKDAA